MTSLWAATLATGVVLAACDESGRAGDAADAAVDATPAPDRQTSTEDADGALGPDAETEPPSAPIDVLVEYAERSCARAEACCAATSSAIDSTRCAEFWGEIVRGVLESITNRGLRLDAPSAEACLAWFDADGVSCAAEEPPACRAFIVGRRRPGSGCGFSAECFPGEGLGLCESYNGAGIGECVQHARGVAGAPCRFTCFDGDCYGESLEPGVAPSAISYCDEADGLVCDHDRDVCVALGAEGEYCAAAGCLDGLVCSRDENVCLARPGLGEPCPEDNCAESTCVDGTCAPRVSPGGACDPVDFATCEEGSECMADRTCGPVLSSSLRNECSRYAPRE